MWGPTRRSPSCGFVHSTASFQERMAPPPGNPPRCWNPICKHWGLMQVTSSRLWSRLDDLPAQVSQTDPHVPVPFASWLTLFRGVKCDTVSCKWVQRRSFSSRAPSKMWLTGWALSTSSVTSGGGDSGNDEMNISFKGDPAWRSQTRWQGWRERRGQKRAGATWRQVRGCLGGQGAAGRQTKSRVSTDNRAEAGPHRGSWPSSSRQQPSQAPRVSLHKYFMGWDYLPVDSHKCDHTVKTSRGYISLGQEFQYLTTSLTSTPCSK